jgi:hypothetical protein
MPRRASCYMFTANNPLRYRDPDGRDFFEDFATPPWANWPYMPKRSEPDFGTKLGAAVLKVASGNWGQLIDTIHAVATDRPMEPPIATEKEIKDWFLYDKPIGHDFDTDDALDRLISPDFSSDVGKKQPGNKDAGGQLQFTENNPDRSDPFGNLDHCWGVGCEPESPFDPDGHAPTDELHDLLHSILPKKAEKQGVEPFGCGIECIRAF